MSDNEQTKCDESYYYGKCDWSYLYDKYGMYDKCDERQMLDAQLNRRIVHISTVEPDGCSTGVSKGIYRPSDNRGYGAKQMTGLECIECDGCVYLIMGPDDDYASLAIDGWRGIVMAWGYQGLYGTVLMEWGA